MAKISFDRIVSEFIVLNPFNNLQEELHRVEVRKDPILSVADLFKQHSMFYLLSLFFSDKFLSNRQAET
jgi:hypothetical protein